MLLSKVTSVKLAEEIKNVHDYLHTTGPIWVSEYVLQKHSEKQLG